MVWSPNHDAGAMIDKEILVDRSSRMDIDACQPMSMLCHILGIRGTPMVNSSWATGKR